MEKALRRQFGADAVDLDTRASTCRVAFDEPEILNFRLAQSSSADANYQLIGIAIEAKGEIVVGPCDMCEKDVHYLKLPVTGQMLELTEPQPLGEIELKAEVLNWARAHPRLVVQ